MSFLEQLKLIKRIHNLIKTKRTGSPDQLARKLEVSRATIFRYINELKELGAPIKYCNFRKSYYYQDVNYVLSF